MDNEVIYKAFQEAGVYSLIIYLEQENKNNNPRVKAYNLLKVGRMLAQKSISRTLHYLPDIAFDISCHESVYRMAAFLYIDFGEYQKALECLCYLHHYYQDHDLKSHKQYDLIKQKLLEVSLTEAELNEQLKSSLEAYNQQNILNNIKDFSETLPETDAAEQAIYFGKIYRHFGTNAVFASITSDVRFNNRQKAVLIIRASRAVAAISDEGPSIESLFANKALELDTSDTVIKNSYQAYLRAGDLNKITQLKDQHPEFL